MRGKTRTNMLLQISYQILGILVPFITTPFLSRTLQAEKIGVYSYTYSYIYYFTMLAMLGVVAYGSKLVASAQDNPSKRNHAFWSIYTVQLISSVLSAVCFFIYWLVFCPDDIKGVMLWQAIYLLACFFDVNWYYFGIENFRVTVTRSIVVKFLSVAFILLLIKRPNDLAEYIAIMAGAQLLNNIVVWVLVIKKEKFVKLSFRDISMHFKPVILLSIPIIAMSLYHLMDKTMLGILSDDLNSGYYYSADKVINIPLCAITGIGTVMLPRISAIVSKGDKTQSNKILHMSFRGYICLTCAMAFGIAAVAEDFVPLFFGKGYEPCIALIMVMAVALPFKAMADMFRTQYLVPYGKNKIYIVSVFMGAALNLAMNYILILYCGMGAMGATVATVITEMLVCLIQGSAVSKDAKLGGEILSSVPYIVFGVIMVIVVKGVASITISTGLKLICEICIGIFIYMLCCFVYWRSTKDEMLGLLKR